ncbi:MAG: hypothetical protein VST71_01635 [Nitrospirota bacterium]|nr:hypothetical protein [Nitrospirota bacterium]
MKDGYASAKRLLFAPTVKKKTTEGAKSDKRYGVTRTGTGVVEHG